MRIFSIVVVLLLTSACKLPGFSHQVLLEPDRSVFGSRCTVRAGNLEFNERTLWGGLSEPDFVATLNQGERAGQENLKVTANEMWLKQLEMNERDYLGARGRLVTQPGGEAWVLRSIVLGVDRRSGGLNVRHEVTDATDGRKIAEFLIDQPSVVGNNFRTRVTSATIPQAWTVLSFFSKRLACAQ